MENRILPVLFYKPKFEDLWFRQAMAADPETVNYICGAFDSISLFQGKWGLWYELWVEKPEKRFYRYIATGKSRSFVGETFYFYDEQQKAWLAGISVCAKCRGQGYESAALQLLCKVARGEGIPEKDIKNWLANDAIFL